MLFLRPMRSVQSSVVGSSKVSLEVDSMPHLLLMGGGHCARAIAEVTKVLGGQCSVTDCEPIENLMEGEEGLHM